MNKKQTRLLATLEIIANNCIGSQDELVRMLATRGFLVTQATLSRDLKSLRVTKVPAELGGYRYVAPHPREIPENEVYESIPSTAKIGLHTAVKEIAFSGMLMVFKTIEGYASGLAYDLDRLESPYILGTIAGADTVILVVPENVSRGEILQSFEGFLPDEVLVKAQDIYS
jgi:transcriptional regulator of arginine metabolism